MQKVFSAKYLNDKVEYYVSVHVLAETKEAAIEKFKDYSVEGYSLFEPSIIQIADSKNELDEDELELIDENGFMESDYSIKIGG